jgi:hypothetical protein
VVKHRAHGYVFSGEFLLNAPNDPKLLERLVGKYQVGPLEVKISMDHGRLFVFGTGQRVPFGMIASSETVLSQRH